MLDNWQERMVDWGKKCFGEQHMTDPKIRGVRMLEEALEFAQSVDVPLEQCQKLVGYVYSRPKGNPRQELGGLGVCCLASANSIGVRFSDALQDEVLRVESKPVHEFTARNKVKLDAGFDGKTQEE